MFGAGLTVYTEENDNGLFHFEFAKSGALIKKTIYEFPIELVNQNEVKSVQNKNTQNEKKDYAGIKNLVLTNVIENTDGSVLLIGTQMTFFNMSFTFGHIIVSKIDASGKLLWMNKIPRATVGYFLYSFNYYSYKNSNYILFADNVANDKITNDAPAKPFPSDMSGNLIAYKIDDATGTSSRNTILNIANINGISGVYFFRSNFFETAPKTFVIEILTDKGKEVFVKMKLK